MGLTIPKVKTKNQIIPQHQKNSAGFTLIELLVVISIIGLLASVVLVALQGARVKARDARRKADLDQIVQAMELYISDNPTQGYTVYGAGYSAGTPATACGCGWFNYQDASGGVYLTSIANALVQAGYFAKAPMDPLMSSPNGHYVNGKEQAYMLYPCNNGFYVYADLENPSNSDIAAYTASKNAGCPNLDIYNINYAVGHF